MDISRRIGIGIVMLIPFFVISGVLWAIFHSYIPVALWFIVMVGIAGAVISGRYLKSWKSTEFRLG